MQSYLGSALFDHFDMNQILEIFALCHLEKKVLFVSANRDLISRVMFTMRDILINETDFKYQLSFIVCLSQNMIDQVKDPFGGMIGVVKDLMNKYAEGVENESIIVDIDFGRIVSIDEYIAQRELDYLMSKDM